VAAGLAGKLLPGPAGAWADNALAQDLGRAVARRAGDADGEAHAAFGLAVGYARSGRLASAVPLFEEALRMFGAIGDRVSQARVHSSLTWIAEDTDRLTDALGHATVALELYQAAGHAASGMALNDVGFCHARQGDYDNALLYCERGLLMARDSGERNWEAATLDSLGFVQDGLGQHDRAVACYEQSAAIYRDLGDRFNEADTLVSLGDAERRAGRATAARAGWAAALAIFDEIGHPDGEQVRVGLAG
jgi:tetratricopeptide (TPR) repeat protein